MHSIPLIQAIEELLETSPEFRRAVRNSVRQESRGYSPHRKKFRAYNRITRTRGFIEAFMADLSAHTPRRYLHNAGFFRADDLQRQPPFLPTSK
ncbi:MAG TPA: hypothetical protein VEH27_00680 [Methylomirabilota bacterium]|nr:hypothetical protein [Methylomirabilota bacterium]